MRHPYRRRRFLFGLAVLALVGTACGGEDTADPAAEADPDATVEPTDTEADTGEDPEEDPDPTGQSEEAFCSMGAQAEEAGASFDPSTASAVEVEAYFRDQLARVEEGIAVAPDAILEAITARRVALEESMALLEPLGWDLAGNLEAATAPFETDEFSAAMAELDQFEVEVCGVTDEDGVEADPPGELTAGQEAYCAHSVEMGSRGDVPFDGAPGDVSAYYDTLIADLARASQLAPPELADDYAVVSDVFAEVYEIIETSGFDLAVAQPNLEEFQAEPGTGDPMEAAVAGIEAYDTEVCGIG